MTKTEIVALVDEHARWVRARYNKKNYKALLTRAAKAACLVLHGDEELGVTAMKSAIAKAHWRIRKQEKALAGVRGYIQSDLPF